MDSTPRAQQTEIVCDCGSTFTSTTHHAVNVTLEPRLLYTLLSGRLNVATCPHCGRKTSSPLPFVYHDMQRELFAYVHPNGDMPEEEREEVLEHLRRVYAQAVRASEQMAPRRPGRLPSQPPTRAQDVNDGARPMVEPKAPPMQVIFGMDQLVLLVDSLLEPEERLGQITLRSTSQDDGDGRDGQDGQGGQDAPQGAARGRLVEIAQRLAEQMDCEVETEERADGLAVTIYGPRGQISQLGRLLRGQ